MAREFEQPEDPDDGEEFQDVCVVDMVSQFLKKKKKNNDQSIQIFYGNKHRNLLAGACPCRKTALPPDR